MYEKLNYLKQSCRSSSNNMKCNPLTGLCYEHITVRTEDQSLPAFSKKHHSISSVDDILAGSCQLSLSIDHARYGDASSFTTWPVVARAGFSKPPLETGETHCPASFAVFLLHG